MEGLIYFQKYRGIVFLFSGIIAVLLSQFADSLAEAHGFLEGYGYTAIVGGAVGMIYQYRKSQKQQNR